MEKDLVHNLIILDESGSMSSAYDATIHAFNQFLGNIKSTAKEFKDQDHFVTFLSFNTEGRNYLSKAENPEKVQQLNRQNYRPDGGTPLFDAIGFSVNKLREKLEHQPNAKVLVSIFTDGYENASKEFTGTQIRNLIETLEQKGWTFTYIGTEHDVKTAAININIKNSISFDKSAKGMTEMFEKEHHNRRNYHSKIRNKDFNLKDNFFKETE